MLPTSSFASVRSSRVLAILACLTVAPLTAQESRPAPEAAPAIKAEIPSFPNPTCPIMGKPTSLKLFVDTVHGRIYTCCAPCNKTIRAEPDSSAKSAYPKLEVVGNAVCPISGKPVPKDGPTIVLQGREVGLCCKDCEAPARADHQLTLAKSSDAKLVDLANPVDPISGKPTSANALVVIDGTIVRLSSTSSLDAVRADPAAALKRAKESVEKPASNPAPRKD